MDPGLIAALVGGLFGGGGFATALVMLLKAPHENRKTGAEAAAVLAGSAAETAAAANERATAAEHSAREANDRAGRLAEREAQLRGHVEALATRVHAIDRCAGGTPCPLRGAPRLLEITAAPAPPG